MKVYVSLLAILLYNLTANAQTITGKVLTENGTAINYATVTFKHSINKVSTNGNGTFTITAARLPDTLLFTAVGHEPYEVIVTAKTIKDPKFEIVLLNSRKSLDDVVVVGYAAKKKKDMTGSVASAYMEAGSVSIDRALEGRLPGVASGDYSSMAKTVRIRGAGSLASSTAYKNEVKNDKKTSFADTLINPKTKRSKLLTAGEVNDFNKWTMWEDFAATDFKTYSTLWGLFKRTRYSVQLQNEVHYPVINQPVYLINKNNGDTLWQAITDNTGKAELWGASADSSNKQTWYSIITAGAKELVYPKPFINGVNTISIKKACAVINNVDIAFVVDATGSMGDEIEFLKVELEDVISKTFSDNAGLNLNMASVFYRDKHDEYLTRHINFNTDILKVLNFIKLQKADGGGDFPEAVNSGLHIALDSLNWRDDARARILFLILDAPPHNDAKDEMKLLMENAASKGIRIVPVVCSGIDKNTEFMMRSLAIATNGTYVFLTDDSGIGEKHIKPTTDVYKIELLNSILQRLIQQMVLTNDCNAAKVNAAEWKLPELSNQVQVFPNPSRGEITVESKKPIKEIFVTDFTGKILQRIANGSKDKKWSIDLRQYPSGTYLIRYVTEENTWATEKVVLAR